MEITPTVGGVWRAARRLAGRVRRTPLERCAGLEAEAGAEIWLKLENLQRTGAFKFRGALNALSLLPPPERATGVVTASAGNHGLGVALAARMLGVRATVYAPAGAPRTKRDRIAAYGAELRLVEGGYDEAHAAALEEAARNGARYLHAFSDPDVVAGQGTVALEILEELASPGTLVVPVGGGGLIGGMGIVARALAPAARVVGVQTPATSAMHDALLAGRLTPPPTLATICEGLAGEIDERSLRLASEVVDEVVLVSEEDVRRAVAWLHTREGITAEGSGAVAVAALRTGALTGAAGPVVAVVTGGNIDPEALSAILSAES